jgi:hypothetical protein
MDPQPIGANMSIEQNLQDGLAETERAADRMTDNAKQAGAQAVRQGQAALHDGKAGPANAEGEGRRWMSWAMDAYQANLSAFQAMMASRSPAQIMAIQSDLVRDQMALLMDASRGMTAAMRPIR